MVGGRIVGVVFIAFVVLVVVIVGDFGLGVVAVDV